MTSRPFSVCVFCGSRPGHDPAYMEAAKELGALLARHGWRLIFGAGDQGMMGAVAAAARTGGAQTLGVIPVHLLGRERTGGNGENAVITETMHERKKVMFMNADALVVLPGGAGSLDEFFEVLTWRQIGLHEKPIFLLNINGYWDPLLALLGHVVAEGFADASLLAMNKTPSNVAQLEHLLLEKARRKP